MLPILHIVFGGREGGGGGEKQSVPWYRHSLTSGCPMPVEEPPLINAPAALYSKLLLLPDLEGIAYGLQSTAYSHSLQSKVTVYSLQSTVYSLQSTLTV